MTESRDAIIEELKQGVIEFNEDMVKGAAQRALDDGVDPYDAIMNGLATGMTRVGELFAANEYFVPEVLMCADALYGGLDILRPHIKQGSASGIKGEVVLGVVEGDIHDIGKNLVKLMFEIAGFSVHDLGRDVPLEKFVEESIRTDSDMVCLSAMMTTTMISIPKIIELLRSKNPNIKVMVGGAPVSDDLAKKWGADGYAPDASNALTEAINMIKSLKELKPVAANVST
jgi:corrinoid protein of di/trimethylamine methyltransferase